MALHTPNDQLKGSSGLSNNLQFRLKFYGRICYGAYLKWIEFVLGRNSKHASVFTYYVPQAVNGFALRQTSGGGSHRIVRL